MTVELWHFQDEDITKLEDVPGALVAWEMGAGKTVGAIERDIRIRRRSDPQGRPTLVVAPLTTLPAWERHFKMMCPELGVEVIDRKNRSKFYTALEDPNKHIFIMHWEAVRLMPKLQQVNWLHIIADECHRMKNRKAQQTQALKKLRADWKTAMSGTPLVNAPQELWSTLNWLYRPHFSSYWRFFKEYVDYDRDPDNGYFTVKGPKNLDRLHRLMSGFYVRRLKKDVMKDLPDKYYSEVYVDLEPKQRRAYDQMKKDLIAWVGEHEHEPLVAPVVIAQLMRLQQFALGYLEWSDERGNWVMAEPSAKLDALMELIEDNPDETFVVFSQFKSPLVLLKRRLSKKGIKYGSITGDDSADERQKAIDQLGSGRTRVVVGTIGAGGVGVDGLQKNCSTVVFLDRAWSPAVNVQAEDRLHRGGQTEPVQVIDIIARNTVDLGRKQRLEQKWEWIRAVLGDTISN